MKVNRVRGTQSKINKSSKAQVTPEVSFSQMLSDKEDDNTREHLHQKMREIEEKGRQLADKKTVDLLVDYKKMLKGFVEEAVAFGLKVEERRGLSRRGRSKVLKVVATIDERVIELTDAILSQEKKQIKILEKIGQIQGLLVNLFV